MKYLILLVILCFSCIDEGVIDKKIIESEVYSPYSREITGPYSVYEYDFFFMKVIGLLLNIEVQVDIIII